MYLTILSEPNRRNQIVLQGDKEMGRTRIALTRASAPQLAINTPRFVPFSSDYV